MSYQKQESAGCHSVTFGEIFYGPKTKWRQKNPEYYNLFIIGAR